MKLLRRQPAAPIRPATSPDSRVYTPPTPEHLTNDYASGADARDSLTRRATDTTGGE